MFIPLTNSLYVEGEWTDPRRVVIDIGTGYYVEQPIDDAQEFFKRKMTYVKQTMDQVQKSLIEKRNQLDYLVETLQTKLIVQQRSSSSSSGGGTSTSLL
jgi:prefoldin alpha subunit